MCDFISVLSFLFHSQHFKDLISLRISEASLHGGRDGRDAQGQSNGHPGTSAQISISEGPLKREALFLKHGECLSVAKALLSLVLSPDASIHSDIFLLTLKVWLIE